MRFWWIVLILLSVACEFDANNSEPNKTEKVNYTRAAMDVQLPSVLWEKIEKVYLPMALDYSAVKQENSDARLDIPTSFFAFKVILTEKTKGILGRKNFEIDFGEGGGNLDLREFVQTSRGTFWLKVDPFLVDRTKEIFYVYYLSNSKERKISQGQVGNGCHLYMDITDYFEKTMNTGGIMVNTTDGWHVSLLVGSYFMAISIKGKLYLSQLTIKDSRYRDLHCKW